MKNLFEQVRGACKNVAANANRVAINYEILPAYAASLPVQTATPPELDPGSHYLGKEEKTVAFLLTLNTINFGSGYFPHLRKRPGMSGYFSIASSLNDVYKNHGGLSAADLERITIDTCTRIFGQDPANQVKSFIRRISITSSGTAVSSLITKLFPGIGPDAFFIRY